MIFSSFDALKSYFTVDGRPRCSRRSISTLRQGTKKAALSGRFFYLCLASALFGFRLCCQGLDQVYKLAAHLGIANLDECAVELKTLRGRQEIDHIVRA
jgi:hypothetical protein